MVLGPFLGPFSRLCCLDLCALCLFDRLTFGPLPCGPPGSVGSLVFGRGAFGPFGPLALMRFAPLPFGPSARWPLGSLALWGGLARWLLAFWLFGRPLALSPFDLFALRLFGPLALWRFGLWPFGSLLFGLLAGALGLGFDLCLSFLTLAFCSLPLDASAFRLEAVMMKHCAPKVLFHLLIFCPSLHEKRDSLRSKPGSLSSEAGGRRPTADGRRVKGEGRRLLEEFCLHRSLTCRHLSCRSGRWCCVQWFTNHVCEVEQHCVRIGFSKLCAEADCISH